MHRSMQRIAAAVFLSGVLAQASAAEPSAIIQNGGFEAGKASWWGEGKWAVVQGKGAEGKAAMEISGGYVCQDKRPVTGGKRYKIAMKVKSDGAPADSVFVQLSYRGGGLGPKWYGPASANGETAVLVTGGTHDWKEMAAVVAAPPSADQLLLYLRKAGGTQGAACYDSVTVTPTDEPVTAGAAFTGEIVRNGTFDKGKDGWWGSGKWEVVADQGVDGSKALRVESGFVCQDKRPVTGRKNYRISMMIRCDGAAEGAAFVQTSYRGDSPIDGWFGPQQVTLKDHKEAAVFVSGGTHPWKAFSVVVTAPPSATEVLLYLRKQAGDGAVFYDNVKIEATDEKALTLADQKRAALAQELLAPALPEAEAQKRLGAIVEAGRQNAGPLTLAENGKAFYRVHVASGADLVSLNAARELAGYLKQIAGADFGALSHDDHPEAGPMIVVGRDSRLTARLCPDIDFGKLGEDGFIIRSAGPHLILAGATPRGTMYAVNWFLDRKLGVKWLSPRYTFVPLATSVVLPAMQEQHIPRFTYREVLSDEGSNAVFASHNLLNGRSHGPSFSPTAPEIDSWDHSWMAKGGSASFYELLPQKVYGKAHPEWFGGGQVAMMNGAMRKAMAQEVIKRLKAHPDYTKIWFNIWQMDWGWDMDPASKAFADKHGGRASAPRLDMMIDIAQQVRQEMPGARLAFNAYDWGFTPPEGMTVPDHILVFPMTLHVDYSTPLNKGRNRKLGEDIAAWTRIAKNVMVWDHITNWAGFIQPTPNLYPIGESISWLAQNPVLFGYFAEGDWNSAGGEFSSLRAWLIARLTWDPQQDVRKLVGEYCRDYFGKASPMLQEYIGIMHAAAARSGDVLGQRFMPDIAMYDLGFITAADRLFDEAEKVVAEDAQRLAHVRHARMGVDYIVMLRRDEYAQKAKTQNLPWQVNYDIRRARFDQAIADNKIREYRQGGPVAELATLLSVERTTPQPHSLVAGLAPTDWMEIQDLAFMRFHDAGIVADPAASDGAAIRTTGKHSVWCIQLRHERVPSAAQWDLYADLRVEAESGHDDDPAARVGSSPPMGLFATAKVSEVSDGRYHLIKIPTNANQTTIYLQPPAKPYIKYIYLDRIIAVRKGKLPAAQ